MSIARLNRARCLNIAVASGQMQCAEHRISSISDSLRLAPLGSVRGPPAKTGRLGGLLQGKGDRPFASAAMVPYEGKMPSGAIDKPLSSSEEVVTPTGGA